MIRDWDECLLEVRRLEKEGSKHPQWGEGVRGMAVKLMMKMDDHSLAGFRPTSRCLAILILTLSAVPPQFVLKMTPAVLRLLSL